MELRHLRVFVAVAEELHFGRAAVRLHLTQPAVSGHIRQLEGELGVQLLRRSARYVALTDAGAAFLEDARRIVTRADAATTSVRSWRQGNPPRLRIGYVDDGFPRALPIALRRMACAAGAPHVQLTRGDPEDLVAQVRDEALDAAIVPLPASVRGLRVAAFAYEHAAVAVSVGLLDGHEDEIPLEIVAQGIVLARPRRANPGFYDAVLAAFRTAGIASPILEVDGVSIEQLLLQVAAGPGMALVPNSVADRFRTPRVGLRRLAHSSPIGCELAIVSGKGAPRPAVSRPSGRFTSTASLASARRCPAITPALALRLRSSSVALAKNSKG
jgi:DNA-binding transcriptional LysR family regulator